MLRHLHQVVTFDTTCPCLEAALGRVSGRLATKKSCKGSRSTKRVRDGATRVLIGEGETVSVAMMADFLQVSVVKENYADKTTVYSYLFISMLELGKSTNSGAREGGSNSSSSTGSTGCRAGKGGDEISRRAGLANYGVERGNCTSGERERAESGRRAPGTVHVNLYNYTVCVEEYRNI